MYAVDEDYGSRVCITDVYPYAIHYFIKPNDTIWIVAVAHMSRRPGYWLHRLES